MVNLTEVIYVSQADKNILIVSRIISKGDTMGDTEDKLTTKNGVNMILDARKGKDYSMVLYLKAKRYDPEGSKTKEANRNLPDQKK